MLDVANKNNLKISEYEPCHGKRACVYIQTVKIQASLRIRAVSPEPMLFAHVDGIEREASAKAIRKHLFRYIENLTTKKGKFSDKKF